MLPPEDRNWQLIYPSCTVKQFQWDVYKFCKIMSKVEASLGIDQ